jgi:uncharacterized protein YecT (DUF1311 family)
MRLFFLLLLIAPTALAYDKEMLDESLPNCHKNQLTENVCAWHQAQLADKALNSEYQKIYNRLNVKNNKTRLQSAQRAWIKFRDENCSYEARGSREEGGSQYPMVYNLCIARMTKNRTLEIDESSNCGNGCPD